MEDIVVKSYNELNSVLYDIPKNQYGRHRSNYVYRGMADVNWEIKTSLIRLGGNYDKVERPLLRAFRKYAEPGWLPSDTVWMQMTVGQHHGLPTRLIDWTSSPQVAVHFATAEREHLDKDGVVWCVDVGEMRKHLPPILVSILENEYAVLFSIEMLEILSKISDLDQLGTQYGPFMLFFEPPSLDSRIVNQGGVMSVLPGSKLVPSEFLKTHPSLYFRIIIPSKIKKEVRDKLDQANVNERMLFPGLDGLSQWLKRYYETW
jgi:hypothetical protein